MKVNNINMNFGKSLIAKCDIKDTNRKAHQASLYEYNPNCYDDIEEIYNSYSEDGKSGRFYRSFLKCNGSHFFVLKDDVNGKTVAVSEITRHIAPNNPVMGNYIEINDIEGDKAYSNVLTPMIAHISNLARIGNMDNVATCSDDITVSDFKKYGFHKVKYDFCIMPKENFSKNVKKAERENQINYCA